MIPHLRIEMWGTQHPASYGTAEAVPLRKTEFFSIL